MPNALSYLALFMSIPVGIACFFLFKPHVAALVVYLGAMMFLPEIISLDLPGLPGIGKEEAPSVACLLGCILRARSKLFRARILRGPDVWFVLLAIGTVGTVLTNTDPLIYGPVALEPLTLHEAISVTFGDVLQFFVPFLIGRALFTSTAELKTALAGVALAALLYTPFMFIEFMMSPQLHNWIYGYHQHDFIQTMRGSGYRPMVFMEHGLAVALFLVWGVLGGAAVTKVKKRVRGLPAKWVTVWLFGFLARARSLGAAVYAFLLLPVMRFVKPRGQVRLAVFFAIVLLSYPIMRATETFPRERLASWAYAYSGERAASLEYRFNMEAMIMEHVSNRALFGWGRFKRGMVFEPETGKELSVSDGAWVTMYSSRGAWGFVCFFMFYLTPIFFLRKQLGKVPAAEDKTMLAALALIVGITGIDMVPNGLFNNAYLLWAGILYGATRGIVASAKRDAASQMHMHMHMQNVVMPQPMAVPGGQ